MISEPVALGSWDNFKKSIFIVQCHDARNLHYDFRLEIDRVLKSWAVPKQPTKYKGIKKLAVHTEDHLLSCANFDGGNPGRRVWSRQD